MNNWSGIWNKVLKMMALAGGAIAGAMGGWDTVLVVLCYMMGIDYVTGCVCGMMGKSPKTDGGKLDSKTGWHGLLKKAVMLVVVFMAAQLDRVMPEGTQIFRDAMCMFYVSNEGLSIIENLAIIGVPFPAFIKKALEQIKQQNDEGAGEQEK